MNACSLFFRATRFGWVAIVLSIMIQSIVAQPTTASPHILREFRAAWVATVANINWPSKPGLSTEVQQKEALALLDFLQHNNMNAVVFQVRPQADALYKSDLEPWSYYLTGTQGKAPSPYYDPLEFWVKAAHERGIELHVWLNPYRAHHKDGGPVSDKSIVKTKPHLAKFLKEGYWWLDPAAQGTQDHSYAVAMDIVKRYDIDGLHFDDYFYPYPSYNLGEDFPDKDTWDAYVKSGGKLSRGDWRRNAVNKFIERLYIGIKAEKPHVKFGLSPFGIWRPGHPTLVEGFDQYEQLYADAKLWLNKGWIDYFTPQLYWPINRLNQSFPVLLGWWESENTQKRHLWPGISIGSDTSRVASREVTNQIMVSRGMLPGSMGIVHWSIGQMVRNPGLMTVLREGPYQQQALVPASPWLGSAQPAAPTLKLSGKTNNSVDFSWSHPDNRQVWQWVVSAKYGQRWQHKVIQNNNGISQHSVPNTLQVGKDALPIATVKVTAISRTGIESMAAEIGF